MHDVLGGGHGARTSRANAGAHAVRTPSASIVGARSEHRDFSTSATRPRPAALDELDLVGPCRTPSAPGRHAAGPASAVTAAAVAASAPASACPPSAASRTAGRRPCPARAASPRPTVHARTQPSRHVDPALVVVGHQLEVEDLGLLAARPRRSSVQLGVGRHARHQGAVRRTGVSPRAAHAHPGHRLDRRTPSAAPTGRASRASCRAGWPGCWRCRTRAGAPPRPGCGPGR